MMSAKRNPEKRLLRFTPDDSQLRNPIFDNSGMNYQQRNRALFECIREPCERTGGDRYVV
jgi:hypothetical protein